MSKSAEPIDLKQRFGSEYRVSLDESYFAHGTGREAEKLWMWRIECKYGHIYPHGGEVLGAYCNRRLVRGKLKKLPCCKVHQEGDFETTVLFHVSHFDEVAKVIKPKRRRRITDEQKQRLAKIGTQTKFQPAHHGTKRPLPAPESTITPQDGFPGPFNINATFTTADDGAGYAI